MISKFFRYAAVAAYLAAACDEPEIAPSPAPQDNNLDKAANGKGKAHLQALSRGLIAYYPFNGNFTMWSC